MYVPTLPAPAMATFTAVGPSRPRAVRLQLVEGVGGGPRGEDVALLAEHVGADEAGRPEPGDGHQPEPARLVQLGQLLARPTRRAGARSTRQIVPLASVHSLTSLGEQPAQHLVGGPATVATVGMPSRW